MGNSTARKPYWVSAQGACWCELPQPKLSPARRICPAVPRGWFRMKSGRGYGAWCKTSQNPVSYARPALLTVETVAGRDDFCGLKPAAAG